MWIIICVTVMVLMLAIASFRHFVVFKPHTVKTPPPQRPEQNPAPEGLFPTRPLLTEWLECDGEYFCKKAVAHLTKNPNDTINIVLVDGHSIRTGMKIDEVKVALGVHYTPSIKEELKYWRKIYETRESSH